MAYIKLSLLAQEATAAHNIELTLTPEVLKGIKAQIEAQWGNLTVLDLMGIQDALQLKLGQIVALVRGGK